MINKIIDRILPYWHNIFNADRWCAKEDRAFYKLYLWFIFLTTYVLIGTYLYDKEMLDIFFWPFNL